MATFDQELINYLDDKGSLIRDYVNRDKAIFLEFDYGDRSDVHRMRPSNEYASAYYAMVEEITPIIATRSIRAWHYTRMTDDEIDTLQRDGIHMSSPESLQARLDSLVSAGLLKRELAERLFERSPFHGDQRRARQGKFWMTSHPTPVDDSGVTRLLRYWGGEVASFWTDDAALLAPLECIGQSRVLELAVPLALTSDSIRAAGAVIATKARAMGCIESSKAFDLHTTTPLPASAIIAVNSHGDPAFERVGCDYPDGFINVESTYWRDLTGEDD